MISTVVFVIVTIISTVAMIVTVAISFVTLTASFGYSVSHFGNLEARKLGLGSSETEGGDSGSRLAKESTGFATYGGGGGGMGGAHPRTVGTDSDDRPKGCM